VGDSGGMPQSGRRTMWPGEHSDTGPTSATTVVTVVAEPDDPDDPDPSWAPTEAGAISNVAAATSAAAAIATPGRRSRPGRWSGRFDGIATSLVLDELRKLVGSGEQAAGRRGPDQRVRGQDDRGRGVGRLLAAGEVDLVGQHDAGPVAVLLGAQTLCPGEQLRGPVGLSDRQMRHGALAGLGRGDPRSVRHAADAPVLGDEGVVAVGEALAAGLAGDGTAEHRVVPVHGPPVLGGER